MTHRPRRIVFTLMAAVGVLALGALCMLSSFQNTDMDTHTHTHTHTQDGGEEEAEVIMARAEAAAQLRLGAGADGKLGVCWDPGHNPNYPGNVAQAMAEDFGVISQHFRLVRTFYSVYFGTEVMPHVAGAGLKAALGVSIANGRAEEEKAAAIRAYHANPDSIAAIYVGNEDLIPVGPFSVDDIIGHIQDLRNAGVKCPIGTAQRINEWVSSSSEIDKLAGACDVIGVNIYPYFSTPTNDGEAWQMVNTPMESLKAQYGAVAGRFPGQDWKIRVTETGWPTAGSKNFAGHDATIEMGSKYFHEWVGWACSNGADSYYYTAFDHRGDTNPDYEKFFGVFSADGSPKYDLPGGVC